MKIRITGRHGHFVYGEKNGMQGRLEYGFKKLGHEIVESGEEMLIVPGASANLKDIETTGKKIFWNHGLHWFRGFETPWNDILKDNFEVCDLIAYQSEFAKHMMQKAFGEKEGPIILNAGIPNFPEKFNTWKRGEEIKIACASVWRAWKNLHQIERSIRLVAESGQKVSIYVIGRDSSCKGLYDLPLRGENYKINYMGTMSLEDMNKIYHQCHIGVHLAFNDFSPSVVFEQMSAGLPMIITNSGGSVDAIGDGSIAIDTDPFVDEPFNVQNENTLPKIDNQKFLDGFWELMNNLETYQQKNREWVIQEANCVNSAQKFLNLYGL